jgi:hypothetical protein
VWQLAEQISGIHRGQKPPGSTSPDETIGYWDYERYARFYTQTADRYFQEAVIPFNRGLEMDTLLLHVRSDALIYTQR